MRLALCASLVTLLPKTVAAAEIDKIELTQDGPKTLLPLRRPFYLTLEPSADVKAAQIVFVRYAFRPFGHHPSRTTCSEVQAALSNVAKGSAAQQVLPAGFQRISAIWETPVEATNDPRARMYKRLKDYGRALVLDAQTITEDKKKLAFLVHSPGFFVDGAAYCMFVYERRSSTLSNELYKSILDATYGQVEDLATPLTAGQSSAANPVPPALSGKVFQAFLADQNLKNLLSKEVLDEVSKRAQGKPTDKEPLKTLMDEVIQGPLTRAWKIAWTGQTIREKIKAWAGALWKEDLPGIGEELIIAHDSLAITLAELLAHHGHLDVKRENGSTSFSLNGKSYDRIRVIGDFSELELIATPTTQPANTAPGRRATAPANVPAAAVPEKHRLKGVSPLDLPLPESTSTLRDMVELTRGALRVGDRYLRGEALKKTFESDELRFAKKGPAPSPNAKKLLERIIPLDTALARALSVRGEPRTGHDYVYSPLGRWLYAQLPRCALYFKDNEFSLNCDPLDPVSWPGVKSDPKGEGRINNPVYSLKSDLDNYFAELENWDNQREILEREVQILQLSDRYPVTALTLEFSTETWVSNHITPVIGGAGIITADQPFMIPYVGAQIFAWPNPVDRPMWTNGPADLRRLFGLELGLGIQREGRTGFGPNDRYLNTEFGLPPVLLGLAIQPIPYVTASVGAAFMRVRRSPLSAEQAQPFQALYVNFSFQLNIFNAVRQLFTSNQYAEARKLFK
jgi:hypothetical protein